MSKQMEDVLKKLHTDSTTGMSTNAAMERLKAEGPNRFAEDQQQSILSLILGQLNNALIYILFAAAFISGVAGEISDAIIIGVVIAINTAIGVIQESKAEKALQELKKMATPVAIVKRDGVTQEIPSEQLVR